MELYREALGILRQRLGTDSPSLGLPLIYLGRALTRTGRAAVAEEHLRLAEELLAASLGEDHYRVDMARIGLAECLGVLGHSEKAEALLRESLVRLRKKFGAEHRLTRQAAEQLDKLRTKR